MKSLAECEGDGFLLDLGEKGVVLVVDLALAMLLVDLHHRPLPWHRLEAHGVALTLLASDAFIWGLVGGFPTFLYKSNILFT